MNMLRNSVILSIISACSIIHFSGFAMKIDTGELVKEVEQPLRKLVRDIREENVAPILQATRDTCTAILTNTNTQLQQILQNAQHNVELISRSTCRNLLWLGCGITGLTILATTVMVPLIGHLHAPHNNPDPTAHVGYIRNYGSYAVGLSSGIMLLAASYLKLR